MKKSVLFILGLFVFGTAISCKKELPKTDEISKKIVSIPIHPNLSDYEIDKIIKNTNKLNKK